MTNHLGRSCGLLSACCVMLALGAGGAGGAGCAKSPGAVSGPDALLEHKDARSLVITDGQGERVSWGALVSACARADVVIVGELHGQMTGQSFQAALFADILAAQPRAGLALEFFERDQQTALDDYLRGVTTEAEFMKAAARTPSNYPAGHRAMVEACKAAGRPVIAANAPRRYVRLARTAGYERLASLTPVQQSLFLLPSSEFTGGYRDRFMALMGGGASHDAATDAKSSQQRTAAEAMFRSQSVWDWTMGESVAMAIEPRGLSVNAPPDPDAGRPIVLIVGDFHVAHDGGTVQAVRAIDPEAGVVTVSVVDAAGPDAGKAKAERGRAAFVVYIGAAEGGKTTTR